MNKDNSNWLVIGVVLLILLLSLLTGCSTYRGIDFNTLPKHTQERYLAKIDSIIANDTIPVNINKTEYHNYGNDYWSNRLLWNGIYFNRWNYIDPYYFNGFNPRPIYRYNGVRRVQPRKRTRTTVYPANRPRTSNGVRSSTSRTTTKRPTYSVPSRGQRGSQGPVSRTRGVGRTNLRSKQ